MATNQKVIKLLLTLTLCLASAGIRAQQNDIAIHMFPSSWYNSSFEPGLDGYGLSYTRHILRNKVTRFNIGGEFSVLRARNEALLGLGINRTVWQAKHFRVSIEANLLNGLALYKPLPLYTGGIEGVGRFDYYVKKRVSLFVGIGARATVCPGYRSYGVWKHSSWPLTIGVRF